MVPIADFETESLGKSGKYVEIVDWYWIVDEFVLKVANFDDLQGSDADFDRQS